MGQTILDTLTNNPKVTSLISWVIFEIVTRMIKTKNGDGLTTRIGKIVDDVFTAVKIPNRRK